MTMPHCLELLFVRDRRTSPLTVLVVHLAMKTKSRHEIVSLINVFAWRLFPIYMTNIVHLEARLFNVK